MRGLHTPYGGQFFGVFLHVYALYLVFTGASILYGSGSGEGRCPFFEYRYVSSVRARLGSEWQEPGLERLSLNDDSGHIGHTYIHIYMYIFMSLYSS